MTTDELREIDKRVAVEMGKRKVISELVAIADSNRAAASRSITTT